MRGLKAKMRIACCGDGQVALLDQ